MEIAMKLFAPIAGLLMAFAIATAHSADDTAWIEDQNGCKIANPHPQPKETVTWSGACVDGLASGEGSMQWFEEGRPTARYEGALEAGWANGKGSLNLPNGAKYVGDWQNSREHGQGRMEWPDGSWYDGDWRSGKPHGYGQYRTAEGRLLTGKFVDGEWEPNANEKEVLPDDQHRT